MKVIHINSNYIYSNLHKAMVNQLSLLGIDNHIYVPTFVGNNFVNTDPKVIVDVCFKKNDRLFFFRKQKKIAESIHKKYDFDQFDCIHAYTLFTDGFLAMTLSEKYGIPYVVAVRNTDVNLFLKYMVHLRKTGLDILKNASAICFLSRTYRDFVLEQYVPDSLKQIIRKKSFIIPNGIDDFWFENIVQDISARSSQIDNDKKIKCLTVGTVDKNKNALLIIKAIREIENKGYTASLSLAGTIKDDNVYKQLCQSGCFEYLGVKTKEELLEVYRKADVFVLPSHKETFGLVYAEAMSQGLPVIYTRGQGFDGQFDEGVVGFSVSDRDYKDVADRIICCYSQYDKLHSAAIKNVYKFQWLPICKTYISLYESIIKIA